MSSDDSRCSACGNALKPAAKFCTQCGAARTAQGDDAAAEQPDATIVSGSSDAKDLNKVEASTETQPSPPPTASAPVTANPPQAPAYQGNAADLVGRTVAFRSLSRADRTLYPEPSMSVAPLPNYVVGRSTAVEASGDWVRLEHSSGVTGWISASCLKIHGQPGTPASPRLSPAAPATPSAAARPAEPDPNSNPKATSMIEALERLNLLHASGALTDAEFARAKETLFDQGSI